MIHRQKTNYNENTDANNWTSRMYREDATTDREQEKQENIKAYWDRVKDGTTMTPAEKAEADLIGRIALMTEGDSSAKRTQTVIDDFNKGNILVEKLDAIRGGRGQSEEDFLVEAERQHRATQQAIAETEKLYARQLKSSSEVYA